MKVQSKETTMMVFFGVITITAFICISSLHWIPGSLDTAVFGASTIFCMHRSSDLEDSGKYDYF